MFSVTWALFHVELLQAVVTPIQKQAMQPFGFVSDRWNVSLAHWSQFAPSAYLCADARTTNQQAEWTEYRRIKARWLLPLDPEKDGVQTEPGLFPFQVKSQTGFQTI